MPHLVSTVAQVGSLSLTFFIAYDLFYVAVARQEIAAMHFFKSAEALDGQCCSLIFEVTATVLENIRDLEISSKLSQYSARFHIVAALTGISLMIRILKGPFAPFVDQERGSTLYSNTIQFVRSASLEKGDLPDRIALFAEQIWSSEKLFKETDGSINITLRVRNRLSASPLYDTIQRWKEEFINEGDPTSHGLDRGIVFILTYANLAQLRYSRDFYGLSSFRGFKSASSKQYTKRCYF